MVAILLLTNKHLGLLFLKQVFTHCDLSQAVIDGFYPRWQYQNIF